MKDRGLQTALRVPAAFTVDWGCVSRGRAGYASSRFCLGSIALIVLVTGCTASSPPPPRTPPATTPTRVTPEVSGWTSTLEHPLLEAVPVDPRDGFDPDEVALLAVVTNPGLRTVRDNRGVAHSQVISAGLLPNPQVSFQSYRPVSGDTAGSVVGYTGQLTVSLSQLFTRRPKVQAAELAQQSVELDIAWSEWTVALQAQLLAYQIILLEQARRIHQTNLGQLEATLAHIRHAASVGGITAAELANTEAALSQAQTANAMTNRDLAARSAELKGLLGGIEGVVEHLAGEPRRPENLAALTEDSLSNQLADRRPDLQAMRIAMRSQDAAYRAATRQAFPSIQLGFQVARDPGNFVALGPTIQMGLPVFNHGQAGQAAARAQSARLTDLFAERLNQARQQIGIALAEIRGTETTLAILDEAIVRQERLVELYEAARSREAVDILVYYAARSTLIQLRLQRVTERTRLWQALVRLRSESGFYQLPDAKNAGPGGDDAE